MKLKCVKIKYDLEGETQDEKSLLKTLPKTKTVEIDDEFLILEYGRLESLETIDGDSADDESIEAVREMIAEFIEAETGYPVADFRFEIV